MDTALQREQERVFALIGRSTAVILAGGKATRMGCRMKSGLLWQGRPFLTVICAELAEFPQCWVSVDRRERFDPGLPMVEDRYPGSGPLGAVYSCLSQAATPLVFFTACDTPLLTKGLIHFLYSQWQDGDDACIAQTGDGRLHPLCGIYSRELAPALKESLDGGERRMMAFLADKTVRKARVPAQMEGQLFNVNTPQAYQQLCETARAPLNGSGWYTPEETLPGTAGRPKKSRVPHTAGQELRRR